ncbi:MAG: hypothetical protein J6X11_08390 [Treponema sp.]|nr:hypothetical protein [Treponema sp.]
MFGFLFKKNFCDIWDNFFHFFIVNLIDLVLVLSFGFLFFFFSKTPLVAPNYRVFLPLLAIALGICLLSVLVFAEGKNAADVANFGTARFSKFAGNILPSLKIGLQFGLFLSLVSAVSFISIPFYFHMWIPSDGSQGSVLGLVFLSIIFWFVLITVLALQWFIPIRNLMGNNFVKCLKKSYILFFDNTWLTIMMGLVGLLNIAISIFSIGMVCSFNGMMLCNTNALRLLLYKYDWYEVNPGMSKAERKDIPWDELLKKDKKTLGPRKFKSFFFPWKE